jgi:hypothetical protein
LPWSTDTVTGVPPSLIVALVLGLSTLVPSGAAVATTPEPTHPEWGSTQVAPSLTLRQGCRRYDYSYAITPPDGDWALETSLLGPGGKKRGSNVFLTGSAELTATSSFKLCRRATKGGTYTIRALVTVQNGASYVEGYLPDTTFQLIKRR